MIYGFSRIGKSGQSPVWLAKILRSKSHHTQPVLIFHQVDLLELVASDVNLTLSELVEPMRLSELWRIYADCVECELGCIFLKPT